MSQKVSWIYQPTKKQFNTVIIVYIIGSVCSVAAMTNLFSTFIDAEKNLILLVVLFLSTATLLQVAFNYFKKKI